MPSASISNTTPFTTYSMTVQARNAIGYGPESPPVEAQFNFNKAEGGDIQVYPNYDGTTETWTVHTFTTANASQGFNVLMNPRPNEWRVFAIGGGGAGGGVNNGGSVANYGGGRGGFHVEVTDAVIPHGMNPVTVGDGGSYNSSYAGNPGGTTTIASISASGGGGGSGGNVAPPGPGGGQHGGSGVSGKGGAGAGGAASGSSGGVGVVSTITNSSVRYGGGGGGGFQQGGGGGGNGGGGHGATSAPAYSPRHAGAGADNLGGGGGGASGGGGPIYNGARGGSGILIIAYRTG